MDFASWIAGMRFVSVVQGDDKQETCMSDRTDCSNVFLLIHSSTLQPAQYLKSCEAWVSVDGLVSSLLGLVL